MLGLFQKIKALRFCSNFEVQALSWFCPMPKRIRLALIESVLTHQQLIRGIIN